MQGVEIGHMNAAMAAVLKACRDLWNGTVAEALAPVSRYGKPDTLGMDAGPEITICSGLGRHDEGAVVVTEEIGSSRVGQGDLYRPVNPQNFRTVFICDPTDRSNQLREFLNTCPQDLKILEILKSREAVAKWEEKWSGPASITGAMSAISCIRRGKPIFSVIVNYITMELFISCPAGNRVLKLPEDNVDTIDLAYVLKNGTPLTFPGIDGSSNTRRFVTFLGDTGKVGYKENFADSKLMNEVEMKANLHYGLPGGPSRILYLSTLQPKESQIGFVLANGEKIGEWVHWLPFVQFARSATDESQPALQLFEVFQDRPWTKEGVLMSTPPNYSVFREYDGKMYVDSGHLLAMPNPSKLRSTLIVAPFDNRWAMRSGTQFGHRSIRF